jgi:hypothetical protein
MPKGAAQAQQLLPPLLLVAVHHSGTLLQQPNTPNPTRQVRQGTCRAQQQSAHDRANRDNKQQQQKPQNCPSSKLVLTYTNRVVYALWCG